MRGDFTFKDFPVDKLSEEIADVITYAFLTLTMLHDSSDADVEKIIMDKFEKVNARIAKGGFDKR